MREARNFAPSRREVLAMAAGGGLAGWSRLYAFGSDFWKKKQPAEWTTAEIEQLTTNSPWAKETSAQVNQGLGNEDTGMGPQRGGSPGGAWPEDGGGVGGPRMGGPGGMGGPRMGAPGGMGGPGIGGPDMSGGRSRGGGPRAIKGIVLWLSAKPVLEALKTQLPEKFANHYVISLRGFPFNGGNSVEGEAPGQSGSGDGSLERLKVLTLLQPKGKEGIQPDLVEQDPVKGGGSTLLFGFSKEKLPIRPGDKDVTFSTRLGRMDVKSKFNLKDMMYQGQLAI